MPGGVGVGAGGARSLSSATAGGGEGTTAITNRAAAKGGGCPKGHTEPGEPSSEPLERVRIQRHQDKKGYRWYGSYRLPKRFGGKEISVRQHQNAEDDRRGQNR